MRSAVLVLLAVVLVGAIAFYLLTTPVTLPASALPSHVANVDHGRYIFTAAGCAECHAVPQK